MKIYSWNVNGFRAILKKGFFDLIKKWDPDILCLQEVKILEKEFLPLVLDEEIKKNYHFYWHNGKKPGYSGVAVLSKKKALSKVFSFNAKINLFEDEGRILILDFKDWILLNIYFPNGHPRKHENNILKYKLLFYDSFLEHLNALKKKNIPIIACGDYNIAHHPIDLARPDENKDSIGFLLEERYKLDQLLSQDYVDVFRYLHPHLDNVYTWWSYRTRARERNVGWRLDYFFISRFILPKVKHSNVLTQIEGSDHCPIFLEIDF